MEENIEQVAEETTITGEQETTPPVETEIKTDQTIVEETPKMVPLAALEDERRKRQGLESKLAAIPQEPDRYFDDQQKDSVFKEYLRAPGKALAEINVQIANLEAVIPDDGADEYRKARRQIAYWNGIKDEFSEKRIEVSEQRREMELAEERVSSELGQDAAALIDYAKAFGFSERDFKMKPELRKSVKRLYDIANAATTVKRKEVKVLPQKIAQTSGNGGDGGGDDEEKILMNPDTPTDVRMAIWRKRKK